jgi:hypothetical protein
MSSNVSTSTRLRSFQNLDFGDFQDYVIEDPDFLDSIVARVIEDTELVIYVLAKEQQTKKADENLTARAIYIYSNMQRDVLTNFSENAIVNPARIKTQSKSTVKLNNQAIVLFSKFVNFYLFHTVKAAAERANEEGTQIITQQHFFSWCHLLPYPLNVYLC